MNKNYTQVKHLVFLAAILIISFNTQAKNNCLQKVATHHVNFSVIYPRQSFVKYLSFNGRMVNNTIVLNWITSQEFNNNYFQIERSFDGKDFTTVGLTLDGFEHETEKEYAFKDDSKLLENKKFVFYRLKQFDNGGKFSYGTSLKIDLKSENNVDLQLYPNPFIDQITLKFSVTENTSADVQIVNMAGKSVINVKAFISKGYNKITVDELYNLPRGGYSATVVVNGSVIGSQKFVK